MFENLLAQSAADHIKSDLLGDRLPPALLFSGPYASGKGTAALELARVLSCEAADHARGDWACPCAACERHRLLEHPDLLMMGSRDFSSELYAAAASWKRERSQAPRFLFKRALGKLLARFSPVLWDGEEQKLGKAASQLSDLRELEEELDSLADPSGDAGAFVKLLDKVLERALALEAGALPSTLPVSWVRNASFWARSTPFGRHKTILIEGVDRLQEGSRNALLKILEEPPATCTLILATTRRHAVMETLLSRLRTYRFQSRNRADEASVVRRVFRDAQAAGDKRFAGLAPWLEGFLPVPPPVLNALAAAFVTALFDERNLHSPSRSQPLEAIRAAMAPVLAQRMACEGLQSPQGARDALALILERTGKFEPRSLYSRFLGAILDCLSPALRTADSGREAIALAADWTAIARSSESAVLTYNQSPPQALEALFYDLFSSLSPAGTRRQASIPLSSRSTRCVPS